MFLTTYRGGSHLPADITLAYRYNEKSHRSHTHMKSMALLIFYYCTKSLARWLALRTIRSPLFFKNKSSSFFVYVILLSYHTQTITHKRTAMLMLSCFFILNNYISDFFIRPPPFRCLFLLFHLQTSFILGGSLWTNILILTER